MASMVVLWSESSSGDLQVLSIADVQSTIMLISVTLVPGVSARLTAVLSADLIPASSPTVDKLTRAWICYWYASAYRGTIHSILVQHNS